MAGKELAAIEQRESTLKGVADAAGIVRIGSAAGGHRASIAPSHLTPEADALEYCANVSKLQIVRGKSMANATAKKLIALEGATFTMKEKHLMMGGSDALIDIPVPTFLVEHDQGLVLFDTGCAPEVASDPEGYWGPAAKFLRNIRYSKEQVVDQQVKLHGYQPADVKYVVVSHLHLDHSGGMKLFPNAQFLVMKGELPYAYWPDRRARNGFILNDLLPTRGFDWKEFEGDTDLFGDGSLMMLKTAGHTPGECSLKVRLKDFSIVLTGDTVHIRPQLVTLAAMDSDYDTAEASASIKRLRDLESSGEAQLWVSHAPEDWANFSHVME
jgi:N-acyl homoserine lactone hydrolase